MIHKRLLFAVVIALFSVLGTDQTRAQDSINDLAARASGEFQVLTAFRNMERAVNQLDHILTYGIIALMRFAKYLNHQQFAAKRANTRIAWLASSAFTGKTGS